MGPFVFDGADVLQQGRGAASKLNAFPTHLLPLQTSRMQGGRCFTPGFVLYGVAVRHMGQPFRWVVQNH